jgi:hypothetical protein
MRPVNQTLKLEWTPLAFTLTRTELINRNNENVHIITRKHALKVGCTTSDSE